MINQIIATGGVEKIDLQLAQSKFSIYVGNGLSAQIRECFEELNPDKIIIITDDTVNDLHMSRFRSQLGDAFPVSVHSMYPGESSKTMYTLEALLEGIVSEGVTKRSLIVSFGGGVVSNVAGMVAGLIFRGLRLVHVPTTVLAQLDAAISRKQAVNGRHGKNLFGLWLAPKAIFADLDYLCTLDHRQMASGFAEAIKLGLIADASFFEFFEQLTLEEVVNDPVVIRKIVLHAIRLTCNILTRDPYEGTSGISLEIGHTIGHAIEILKKGELTHGEAISIGMVIEARLSVQKGVLDEQWLYRIIRVLKQFELPYQFPPGLDVEDVIATIRYDNKRTTDYPCFVAIHNIGKMEESVQRQKHRLEKDGLLMACELEFERAEA